MSTPRQGRTALAVVVAAAEPLVGTFRARHDARALERRIPPHITVLTPWVAQAELTEAITVARALFEELPAFDAELTRVDRFPENVWLAPEPRARFVELTRTVQARFPDHPPYGGSFDETEPHLTIGEIQEGESIALLVGLAETELGHGLPLGFRVEAVTVLAEQADDSWAPVAVLPLRP